MLNTDTDNLVISSAKGYELTAEILTRSAKPADAPAFPPANTPVFTPSNPLQTRDNKKKTTNNKNDWKPVNSNLFLRATPSKLPPASQPLEPHSPYSSLRQWDKDPNNNSQTITLSSTSTVSRNRNNNPVINSYETASPRGVRTRMPPGKAVPERLHHGQGVQERG